MARQPLIAAAFVALAGACSGDRNVFATGENDFAQRMADRIVVRESAEVFDAFVLLNAAGYDEESAPEMHPVRRAVRGALPRVVSDPMFARAEEFYKANAGTAELADYARAAFSPGIVDALPRTAMANLSSLIKTFAEAAKTDSLRQEHLLRYRVYVADLTVAARREVATVARYLRITDSAALVGPAALPTVVIPNLLQAYDQQFSFTLGDTLYVVVGPTQVVGFDPRAFVRAHLGAAVATSSDSLAEPLARAVALRYVAAREPGQHDKQWARAEVEARTGLVLVPYFYEQLVRYEKQSRPLKEYYPRLLDALDAGREAARWR